MVYRLRKTQFLLLTAGFISSLFFLALVPETICLKVINSRSMFTVFHLAAYFALGALLCLCLRFQKTVASLRMTDFNVVWLSVFVAAIAGGATEWIQIFSLDRVPDWFDFYCDMIGAGIGILGFFVFRKASFQFSAHKAPQKLRQTQVSHGLSQRMAA